MNAGFWHIGVKLMSLKEWLLILLFISLAAFIAVIGLISRVKRQQEERVGAVPYNSNAISTSAQLAAFLHVFFTKSYLVGIKIPVLSGYILLVRKKLSYQQGMSEYSLRCQTMKLTWSIWISFLTAGGILFSLQPGISFLILSCLVGVIINSLFLDMTVARQERKLLSEMIELFADVRHRYHQHGMVEEALYEAAEFANGEAARHAMHIYAALTSVNPDEALERYYETAPNRFLKAFAGISYMVMEFGDQHADQSSIYLTGISSLTQEIHLEILRLDKLDYLLKGLNLISLIPVFFTKPIENWARSSFPTMNEFYDSKMGFIILLSIYVIIIGCYLMLQQLQRNQETTFRITQQKRILEKKIYRWKWIQPFVSSFVPQPGTKRYHSMVKLLRDTNTHLKVEWFVVRRLLCASICFFVAFGSVLYLHHVEKQHILTKPVTQTTIFGKLPDDELEEARAWSELDEKVMRDLNMNAHSSYEEVERSLLAVSAKSPDQETVLASVPRIMDKLQAWNDEFLKWWELALCFGIGYVGFQLPLLLLYMQRKVRSMDMKHEIYQYQTVISILREMDRMSVEEILEWLNRFAVIFKTPLQKCLLHFEQGPEAALELLKEEVTLPEFQRMIDKLMLSLGAITIKEAFDDLEGQMSFYFEQRRQEYAQMIDKKAEWGKMIGFTPMYSLIFLYLVIPLITVSFAQMNIYYEQIQKL